MIRIRGANENNLKSVDLDIPRNQFIVFTGLSGSGKSSLAFDTIYAEGQRRYMESLSSYARQFLGQMEKPDVESIEGLPPAISIDQKTTNRNPRSTVGTVTENAYKKVNGETAGKNPTGIRYITGMISEAEEMIVIMTDDEKGGTVVKPLDMSYVMDFKDMFYIQPEVIKPQSFGTAEVTWYEYVNNNGIIYRRENRESGYPKYGVAVKGEYDRIAPFDFFDATGSYVAWFYDQGRERFIYLNCPLQGDVMIELQDMSGAFNPNNVGMQMLWGGAFGSNNKLNNGRMVMEDDAGERWMLSFTSSKVDNQVVFTPLAKIQLTYEGAREAHTFTTAQNANFLYYGYDNKIACVSFSTGNLLNVYEMEGGNVDYIECDQVGNINQMWVGISDGSGTAKSGSIVVLEMSTDGSLKEVTRYKNVCGKVVDFEYKQ